MPDLRTANPCDEAGEGARNRASSVNQKQKYIYRVDVYKNKIREYHSK